MKRYAATYLSSSVHLRPRSDVCHRQRTFLLSDSTAGTRRNGFRSSAALQVVRPYLLADIGEGITECQITNWFVKPGDRVAQFDPICEVASDKATVEITSRFDGTITSLCYEHGDIAFVGQPLVELNIEDDQNEPSTSEQAPVRQSAWPQRSVGPIGTAEQLERRGGDRSIRHATVDHEGIFAEPRADPHATTLKEAEPPPAAEEVTLSQIEKSMFENTTRSLKIPHFLFTHSVEFTKANRVRKRLNQDGASTAPITPTAIVMKALSEALKLAPKLNAHLETGADSAQPHVILHQEHNFGVAIDTPGGLLVPVIRRVQDHSVASLAEEIRHLTERARSEQLEPRNLQGATFAVSNIGSLGGDVVAPILIPPMVGIVAIGRIRAMPCFSLDSEGREHVVKQEMMVLSWSADHRLIDGATVARAARKVEEVILSCEGLPPTTQT